MTETTTVAPPLTRRQAREIERRTGVRPVAVTAPTSVAPAFAPPAFGATAAAPAQFTVPAADLRARLAIASDATRARVHRGPGAARAGLTVLSLPHDRVADVSTTAELARDALPSVSVDVPAAFGGPARTGSVRAATPVALVQHRRRVRSAGFAFAASAAAFATVGAVTPGILVPADAAQASLVNADAVAEPATQPAVAVDTAAGTDGTVAPAVLVAAPESAVDRGDYTVTTVSAEGVASAAAEAAAPAPVQELIVYADPYPTGRMNEGMGTRGGSHNGIDMDGGGCGAQLLAVASGTVTYSGYQGGYGNHVEIRLDEGDVVSYSHLQSASPLTVGQHVAPGDYVGPVGTTGNSTGCHLHFEVKVDGSFFDPAVWLSNRGVSVDD